MGFADFLHDNTPSIEKLYNDKLNSLKKEIMDKCRYASQKGNTEYSSYGDRYGLSVSFPEMMSSRQMKEIAKRMPKDIEKFLLSEGFKYPIAEIKKSVDRNVYTSFIDHKEIRIDVSCNW